eukprot:CAMPEP_0114975196 /NCGR_PEP_ID=MMETSP0216-20121206/1957_1 /TAXON_ID=223996 /ORGANISM="Protocruzia adherens, Strain Boccale" /LENGTH=198 /DNA_ID=CAMNT_0002335935 /DNA_START=313 /DNA_END=905 /DNA_ORIENTATION=+
MDTEVQYARSLDGAEYIPGCIGLNNIKRTDYVNVVLQALCRVSRLRDFFIKNRFEREIRIGASENNFLLSKRLSELICKIFKDHVSPHDVLQAIVSKSQKKFQIEKQGDPHQLVAWLLNMLHSESAEFFTKKGSIIHHCFQGETEMTTLTPRGNIENITNPNQIRYTEETKKVKFLFLTLDIPPPPLFSDAMEKNMIP